MAAEPRPLAFWILLDLGLGGVRGWTETGCKPQKEAESRPAFQGSGASE